MAWFTFDPCLGGPDLNFSEDNCSVSCEGYEHRVALGSVGFSRGVHYWEFTVDRYDADTDPSFGIARIDCVKDQMLGEFEESVLEIHGAQSAIMRHCALNKEMMNDPLII